MIGLQAKLNEPENLLLIYCTRGLLYFFYVTQLYYEIWEPYFIHKSQQIKLSKSPPRALFVTSAPRSVANSRNICAVDSTKKSEANQCVWTFNLHVQLLLFWFKILLTTFLNKYKNICYVICFGFINFCKKKRFNYDKIVLIISVFALFKICVSLLNNLRPLFIYRVVVRLAQDVLPFNRVLFEGLSRFPWLRIRWAA